MGTRPLRKPGSCISPRTLATRRSYAFLTASAVISTVSWTSFSAVGSTFVFTIGSPSLRLSASGASRAGIRSVVRAGVAELVDALDLGSGELLLVEVQVLSPAPQASA